MSDKQIQSDKTDKTNLTIRVIEDSDDVKRLEQRLAIAQRRLDLSEVELNRISNPRQSGVIDLITAILQPDVKDRLKALSSAVEIWLALRRSGDLKDE